MNLFLVSLLSIILTISYYDNNFLITIIQLFRTYDYFYLLDKSYDEEVILVFIRCGLLASILATLCYYRMNNTRKKHVYLVDFACYKHDNPACMCTKERFLEISKSTGTFRDESINFATKILEKSGISEKAYAPEPLFLKTPPNASLAGAREERESVVIGTIDELLLKTKVKPEEIGIVVTNCSVFNSMPSLSGMIVNHYKLRNNVVSYNLTGMGCSAGLISIDLAKQLLQVRPNSYALVFSTENITGASYFGNNRSMFVSNCIFRMGAAAILLSNRSSDSHRSKYYLKHIVRTHKGSQDDCYNSVLQKEDEEGFTGVSLSKNIMSSAGKALNTNISTLGKCVLPWTEQIKFLTSLVMRDFFKIRVIKSYTPNFVLAFEHFCIHTGGKVVQDEMQKMLKLSDCHMEPSRMTLYRYGNTSSSSVWYELAYCEAKGRVKKGDQIWQIAFGSGFKCNSVVWHALHTIDPVKIKNSWTDEIHEFPVNVTN